MKHGGIEKNLILQETNIFEGRYLLKKIYHPESIFVQIVVQKL